MPASRMRLPRLRLPHRRSTAPLACEVVDALRPHFPPDFDFASIRVCTGIPRWAAGRPSAVTFRHTIYFAAGCYEPASAAGIALIAHELAHVEQYRRLGAFGFGLCYVAAYAANRLRGHDREAAYQAIPLECAARDVAAMVERALARDGETQRSGLRNREADTPVRNC